MISTLNQEYLFAAMLYGGIIAGAIYDIVMWAFSNLGARFSIIGTIAAAMILLSGAILLFDKVVDSEIRLFHFIGLLTGFSIYKAGISVLLKKIKSKLFSNKVDRTESTTQNNK